MSSQTSLAAFAVRKLFNAAASGDLAVIQGMLKDSAKAVISCSNSRGQTPLAIACAYGQYEVVELLIRSGCPPSSSHPFTGTSPLHIAASNGFSKCVRALLSTGADSSAADAFGNTADIFASAPPMISSSGSHGDPSSDSKLVSMRKECLRELRHAHLT